MGALRCTIASPAQAATIVRPDLHELQSLMETTAHTKSVDEVCADVGLKDRTKGLDDATANDRMEEDGGNDLTDAARPCSAWLCCLLPCLNNTEKMVQFRNCIPKDAVRLYTDKQRGGKTGPQLIDATGLVRGDVILIGVVEGLGTTDDSFKVPADALIFECSDDFKMDRTDLRSDLGTVQGSATSTNDDPLKSGNTAFLGTKVMSGSAKAVVVAVGTRTQWCQLKYES